MGSFKSRPGLRSIERHETRDEMRVRKTMFRTLIGTFDLPLSRKEYDQAIALGREWARTPGEQDRLAEASAGCVRRRRRIWFWWASLMLLLWPVRMAGKAWRALRSEGPSDPEQIQGLRTAAEAKAIRDTPTESRHLK